MQPPAPRLIVSDIDGTLITSHGRVPERTQAVLSRAVDAGAVVLLATGRPFHWLLPVVEQLPVRPICVTANGAVIYDSATDEVLHAHELEPTAMRTVYEAAQEALRDEGGVSIAAERATSSLQAREEEAFVIAYGFLHAWESKGHLEADVEKVLEKPVAKLLLRNERLTAAQMYEAISPHVDPDVAHLTFSMNSGLIEVGAPGINKAAGIATVAESLGIDASEAVAFGDMPNDLEMLNWVGLSVAMGNARPEVQEAADEVTGSNDDAGVADVLERWF